MAERRSKYARVVSFSRMGVCHSPSLATAAAGDQADAARHLFRGSHGYIADLAALGHGRSALGQRELGGDFVPMAGHQEADAPSGRASPPGPRPQTHLTLR